MVLLLRFRRYLILCLLIIGIQSVFADTSKNEKNPSGKTKTAKVVSVLNRTSLAANRHLVSPESDIEASFVSEEAADERLKAVSIFSELDKSGRYLEDLLEKDMLQLPIGFKKQLGTSGSVEVAVSSAEFYAQYAELTLYVRMALPASGSNDKEKVLYFGAEKVRFTRAGGISSFKAVLLGDVPIVDSQESYTVIIKGANGLNQAGQITDPNQTYAQIDCGNFTEAQLTAEVLIPRKTIIPLTEGTLEPMEGRVTCAFRAKIKSSVDNLVGSLTFKTPFGSPNASGFAFKVINASFDLSNADNPNSIIFPSGYKGDQTSGWQGVYIQNFTAYLPKQFKKKNSTARTSLSVSNVVIDKTGFTGVIEANTPIFSINEGSASGWAMSLDRIKVGIVQNTLTEGAFTGQLRLPVSKKTTLLYNGYIEKSKAQAGQESSTVSGLDYGIEVANADDIDFDLFKARGKVYAGSSITLKVVNDEFKPEANLSGNLTVSTSLDGQYSSTGGVIRLEQIEFIGLKLNTGPDPICVTSFELKGKAGVANFPVSITKLGLKTSCANGGNLASVADLYLEAQVALVGEKAEAGGSKGVGGSIGVTIRAQQNSDGDWKFKEIAKPIKIGLKGDLSAFAILGELELYDNEPVQGQSNITKKGFRGKAELVLKSLGNMTVCAEAEFGSTTSNDNYFYVAGSVKKLPVAIPIAGPIVIDGFAGGIFYHMKPTNGSGNGTGFKTSCSTGQTYVYSSNTSFGFKAGVNLSVQDPLPKDSFDGYGGLEMVFSKDGGLASLGIYAQAQLMSDVDNDLVNAANEGTTKKAEANNEFDKEPNRNGISSHAQMEEKLVKAPTVTTIFDTPMTAPLAARVGILLNFQEKTFDAQADLYVNIGYLKGINDGSTDISKKNLAGRMLIHADKNLWYIHVGTSENPVGLAIRDLPKPLDQSYIESKAYLMIGGNIPAYLPPLSNNAAAFFGVNQDKKGMLRSSNSSAAKLTDIESGKGFAFGLNFDAKIKVSGLLYAEGNVGVGLDILYTTKGNCGVATAKGRAYAYVSGEIGIAGVPILGAGVGVLLEGGAPAPTYFTGTAVVEVTVLLVTMRETLKINIGDENNCPQLASGN